MYEKSPKSESHTTDSQYISEDGDGLSKISLKHDVYSSFFTLHILDIYF